MHLKNYRIIFALILLIAFIFRFYRIYSWLFFGMDQEYEAFIIKNILNFKHFPLIGVNASDTGLYLGPAFIYIASIPYALFGGHPIGGAIFTSLLGVATTFAIYKLGKVWFGVTTGLIASFFWASSFISVLYDRQFWNPTLIPFLTVIILYSITQIGKGRKQHLIVLSLSFGLALQSHLQAIILLPLIVIFLIKFRRKISRKYLVIFILILFLFQIPLILFDIRHNFTNLKALTNIGNTPSQTAVSLSSGIADRSGLFLTMLGRAFYIGTPVDLYIENGQCKDLVPYRGQTNPLVIFLILAAVLFFIYQKLFENDKSIHDSNIISVMVLLTSLSLIIYNRPIFEYYYLFFLPVLFLISGYTFSWVWHTNHKILVSIALLLFVIANLKTIYTAKMGFPFTDKVRSAEFAKDYVEESNYELQAIGGCGKYGGYRYLFEYFGNPPGLSYMDQYFSWLYGQRGKKDFPKEVLLQVKDPREKITTDLPDKEMITSAQFGNILVSVFKNAKNKKNIPLR